LCRPRPSRGCSWFGYTAAGALDLESHERPTRVAVVGTSCSGKTSFARALALRLGVPHVELDALHWGPNWTPEPTEVFRARVDEATAGERWVSDGNYSRTRDLVWVRATTLVWLNYSFPVTFYRAVSRTFRRTVLREELYSGNREPLSPRSLLDPEWIPWGVIRTYRRRRREYPALFRRPEYAPLDVLEFRKRAEAEAFLRGARLGDGGPAHGPPS
jgi:adenylate kinase family enzyme